MGNGYGSKKFILAILGLAISSFLVWAGRIDGGDYVTLNSVLGGAYMLSNAYVARAGILGINKS